MNAFVSGLPSLSSPHPSPLRKVQSSGYLWDFSLTVATLIMLIKNDYGQISLNKVAVAIPNLYSTRLTLTGRIANVNIW